jgi:hypothetical protein
MKKITFSNMSDKELAAYHAHSEQEVGAINREVEFRNWCKENDEDPTSDQSRESYNIVEEECGRKAWDTLDENDKDGWTDNITKGLDD